MSLSLGFSFQKGIALDGIFDFVSLGGGPAGYNAGLYAKRKGLRTLVIAPKKGGQLLNTSSVDNYLGMIELSGEALSEKFLEHLEHTEVDVLSDLHVVKVEKKDHFELTLEDGRRILARTILIATGSHPRKLGVKGEDTFANAGVAYCAICDAPLYKNKDVIIAGGGNSAVEAAIDVAKIAKHVTIVHRSAFRADQILLDKLAQQPNVTVHLQTQILEIQGDDRMRQILVLDKLSNQERTIKADGIFIEIGNLPNSDLVKGFIATNDRGEILVDGKQATHVPGAFAAGDVTDTPYKQIIIAAAQGATAALAANDYLNTH
jgi:alkyl hydroperoxide reductase subunit F